MEKSTQKYDVIELSKMKIDEIESIALEYGIDNKTECLTKQPLIYLILNEQQNKLP